MKTSFFLFLSLYLMGIHGMAQTNTHKAPLYWSAYENLFLKEQAGRADVYISETEWMANIDWVDTNLKQAGYNMVCIDGWGDVSPVNQHGYRLSHSKHWQHDFAWWSEHLQERGMLLGMYDNPLWIHVAITDTKTFIQGTDRLVSSLINDQEPGIFHWVQVNRPGAEAYVKGYIQHYADMGITYLRVDFLSWFEDGKDRWQGRVGATRKREDYITALRYMREACDENNMLLSLVMPHLYHEAEAEKKFGHMIRINEDTGTGGWERWSDFYKGEKREGWSVYGNAVDGLTYWSSISGRTKVILDPDFIRLNTFENKEEKESVISLCLMAGAPITIADQHNSIGDDLHFYTNSDLLDLHHESFIGKPLSHDPLSEESQIWTGQLNSDTWVIALFNRTNEPCDRGLDFSTLGITQPVSVKDLWTHKTLGTMVTFHAKIPAHGCRVLRLTLKN